MGRYDREKGEEGNRAHFYKIKGKKEDLCLKSIMGNICKIQSINSMVLKTVMRL